MSLFSEGWLYHLAASSLQQALCILKCAVSIRYYTCTVCIIQYSSIHCAAYSVQCTLISLQIGPETTITMMGSFLAKGWVRLLFIREGISAQAPLSLLANQSRACLVLISPIGRLYVCTTAACKTVPKLAETAAFQISFHNRV